MKLPTLTQIAKGEARFLNYMQGSLTYQLMWLDDFACPHMLQFNIPIDDAGEGAFLPEMRGIQVLRWARKHVEMVQAGIAEQRVTVTPVYEEGCEGKARQLGEQEVKDALNGPGGYEDMLP